MYVGHIVNTQTLYKNKIKKQFAREKKYKQVCIHIYIYINIYFYFDEYSYIDLKIIL